MGYKLPSTVVPITLVADVVTYLGINPGASITQIGLFAGRSSSYVRSALDGARMLGLAEEVGGSVKANDGAVSLLGRTPGDETKKAVMRKAIQEWEPFILFVRFCLNGTLASDAARKVYVVYDFKGVDHRLLEKLILAWGQSTDLLRLLGNRVELAEELATKKDGAEADLSLEDDLVIRLEIVDRLGEAAFAFLMHDEVHELVDAYKRQAADARGAIECAGRALEDFLRRVATRVSVDVAKANGIGQVANLLYNNRPSSVLENKIHSKHLSVVQALADIRNMAGHGKEAKTLERWDLTALAARAYFELTLVTIRSIYSYVEHGTYVF